jgi:hypothetical protein
MAILLSLLMLNLGSMTLSADSGTKSKTSWTASEVDELLKGQREKDDEAAAKMVEEIQVECEKAIDEAVVIALNKANENIMALQRENLSLKVLLGIGAVTAVLIIIFVKTNPAPYGQSSIQSSLFF